MATTLADLIEAVAGQLGHTRRSTATGGTTTTIVDTATLIENDDYWIGHYAFLVADAAGEGAAPEGEERAVTDFDRATATLTVDPAFTAAVGSGDTYALLPARRADVKRAINAAIEEAGETWLVPMEDESTVTVAADDYDYTLPTDVVQLQQVWVRSDTDERYRELPGRMWEVIGTYGTQELVLSTLDGLEAGDVLQLRYLARPSALTDEDDTLEMGAPGAVGLVRYVRTMAEALAHKMLATSKATDKPFRPHYTLWQSLEQKAERIKKEARRQRMRGTVRGPRWPRARG
jgi:hypothetical protein